MTYNYQDLFENLHDGVYFTDRDRKIIFWNKAAENITGYKAGEVIGLHCSDNILVHVNNRGDNLCKGICPLAKTIADGKGRQAEVFLSHKKGHRIPVGIRVVPLKDSKGNIIGGAEIFSDISYKSILLVRIKELEKLALVDNLTNLANRNYLESELEARIGEMKRYGLQFGILFMDIDHFKKFNDDYGHDTGDMILKTIANTMISVSRPFDLIGRWGGEEFIGIIRYINARTLKVVGNRYRKMVEQTKTMVNNTNLNFSISIGATLAKKSDTIDSLVMRADELMYRSKHLGRNILTMD